MLPIRSDAIVMAASVGKAVISRATGIRIFLMEMEQIASERNTVNG